MGKHSKQEFHEAVFRSSTCPEKLAEILFEMFTNLDTVQGGNGDLSGKVAELEKAKTTLEGKVSKLEGDMNTANGKVSTLEGTVSSLGERVTALETPKQ